jgi:hypothetical protein
LKSCAAGRTSLVQAAVSGTGTPAVNNVTMLYAQSSQSPFAPRRSKCREKTLRAQPPVLFDCCLSRVGISGRDGCYDRIVLGERNVVQWTDHRCADPFVTMYARPCRRRVLEDVLGCSGRPTVRDMRSGYSPIIPRAAPRAG